MDNPTTVVRGRRVQLPGTLNEIRAALPEDRRAAFDDAIGNAPIRDVARIALLDWALPEEATADDEAMMARIQAGDMSAVQYVDESALPDAYTESDSGAKQHLEGDT